MIQTGQTKCMTSTALCNRNVPQYKMISCSLMYIHAHRDLKRGSVFLVLLKEPLLCTVILKTLSGP